MMTSLLKFNLSRFLWTPSEELYTMEILSGMKYHKDQSYLSSFRLFDINVKNFLISIEFLG